MAKLTHKPIVKLGFITFRWRPDETFEARNVSLTKTPIELIRLRDDITSMLHDPASWLYTPNDRWDQINIPEGFGQKIVSPWANES